MAITGRRLTVVLATLLAVIIGAGALVAWQLGRQHTAGSEPLPAGYAAGPSTDRTVRLAGAADDHPRGADVQLLLQRYFDAINSRDHEAWVGTVSAAQSAGQPSERWRDSYSTTIDSNMIVVDIADDPLRARVMFTSNQDVRYAPRDLPADCIDWDLTYLIAQEDGRLVLSGLDPSAQRMTACG